MPNLLGRITKHRYTFVFVSLGGYAGSGGALATPQLASSLPPPPRVPLPATPGEAPEIPFAPRYGTTETYRDTCWTTMARSAHSGTGQLSISHFQVLVHLAHL